MQVVTPENFTQLIETGKVPEFKAPEAPKPEAKAEEKPAEQPRGEDGKFVAKDATLDTQSEKSDNSATVTTVTETKADDQPKAESDDDDDLPEKVRKKIGAKHRAMKEAEEFAEREFNKRKAAERRAEEAEQELARHRSKSGHAPDGAEGSKDSEAPKQEDFKTVGEYAAAYVKYELGKQAKESAAQAAKSAQETAIARIQRQFVERQNAVQKEIPDYTEALEASEIVLPNHAMAYVMESEVGPKLAYHLAKNPQEASRIAQLSPIRAIAELGKLEAKLEKPATQESKVAQPVVSKAPSPIKPLNGDGAVPVHKDPATMTFQELREYERQREADKRARR